MSVIQKWNINPHFSSPPKPSIQTHPKGMSHTIHLALTQLHWNCENMKEYWDDHLKIVLNF